MSDPVGTIGMGKSERNPALDDLALAYEGGPKFADRIAQLSEAKDAHDAAFVKLHLGNDVVVAKAAAQKALEMAQHTRDLAADTMAKARADAEKIKKDAQEHADSLVAEARQRADDFVGRANDAKRAADRHVEKAKAEADSIKGAAKALKEQAEEQLKAAEAHVRDQVATSAELQATATRTRDLQAELQSKLARLHSVVADLKP